MLKPTLEHYKRLGIQFECVYSGWLGSPEQIGLCLDYFKSWPEALAVVDPGDGRPRQALPDFDAGDDRPDGEAHSGGGCHHPEPHRGGTAVGGRITPARRCGSRRRRRLLSRLANLGPRYVVVTGVEMADDRVSNIGYDREQGQYWRVDCNYVPVSYPGTGDIFASVLVGGLLGGDSSADGDGTGQPVY